MSKLAETELALPSDVGRYEQACDQAIAMCDGNMRSTIKALIMANEYLETELEELQTAASTVSTPARLLACKGRCRLIDIDQSGATPWPMSLITSRCHSCRTTPARRSRAPRKNARVRQGRCDALKFCREAEGSIGAVAFSRTGDPMIGEFSDAQLLRKFGDVPDDLSGL